MRIGVTFDNILSRYLHKKEGYYKLESSLTSEDIIYEVNNGNFDSLLYMVKEQDILLYQNINFEEEIDKVIKLLSCNVPMMFISSEHVFNGYSDKAYTPTDYTDPINLKGQIDLEIEKIVIRSKGKIVRTSDFFMEHTHNFLTELLRNLAFNYSVQVENKRIINPTYIPHFFEALDKVMLNKDKYPDILHIAGCDYVNKARFYKEVAEFWEFDEKLVKPVLNKYIIPKVCRRGGLDTNLSCKLKLPIYSYREGMVSMKENFTKEVLLKQIEKGELCNGHSDGHNGTSNIFFNSNTEDNRVLVIPN